jgi:membrane protease YdiL (CAAX protease family)
LIIGGIVSYQSGGWPAVATRCFNWKMLPAFGCYLPWALIQQTLLEFYLLGRLLALFPRQLSWMAFVITGICFGLVHFPDLITAAVVVVSGTIWSFMYFRYRLLLPLAFSHAMLGTAFYYGLFGQDLSSERRALLP